MCESAVHGISRRAVLAGGAAVASAAAIGVGGRAHTLSLPATPVAVGFSSQMHGLTFVSIDGPRLRLRHVNVEGKEVDHLELRKPEPARAAGG